MPQAGSREAWSVIPFRRMTRVRKTALSFGVLAFVAIVSCREPTEVTVRITSGEKCTALSGVQIVVGQSQAETQDRFEKGFTAAVTRSCDPTGFIGTLVVTPGGSGGTIVVSAGVMVGGAPAPDPTTCADPVTAKSCIIARRSFSFVDHTSLLLPIELDPACVGKVCDPASTCFKGGCVAASVTCNGDQCGLPEEHPGEGDAGARESGSSDGAYDADLDGMSLDDTSSSGDTGTPITDASAEADSAGFDASGATCGGGSGSFYCTQDGMHGHQTTGTCGDPSNTSQNCCRCACPGSGKVVACNLMMSGASFYCNLSCQ